MVSLLLINSSAPLKANALPVQDPNATLPPSQRKTKQPKRTAPTQKRPQPTSTPKVIYVSNVSEFIRAIRPGVEIKLKQGVYNLSNTKRINTQYVHWRNLSDNDYEPIISSVYNLTITGEPETKLLIAPYMATVLSFDDSAYIRINNITIGHYKDTGACEGDVLAFRNVSNIEIKDSILFGSGAHGVHLTQIVDMLLTNSTIKGCTEGIAYVRDSERIRFERSIFKDNSLYSNENLIEIIKSEAITFSHCNMENNTTAGNLFDIDEYSKNVVLSDSQIIGNKVPKFINVEGRLMMSTNTFEKNNFDR